MKKTIAKKLGKEFSLEKLEKEYGMMDHSDSKDCKYNPLKLSHTDAFVHESYGGLADEVTTSDGFHAIAGEA